jgi:hypothetical protein
MHGTCCHQRSFGVRQRDGTVWSGTGVRQVVRVEVEVGYGSNIEGPFGCLYPETSSTSLGRDELAA